MDDTTTPRPPYVFLDVDGVVNVSGPLLRDPWGDGFTKKIRIDHGAGYAERYRLRLSRALGAALAALPASIVWLTTWEQHANRHVGGHIGLSPRPHLARTGPYDTPTWDDPAAWKAVALAHHVRADPRPFVWVDDDAQTPDALRYVEGVADEVRVAHLIVTPDENFGLTPEQVAEIAAFVASQT